MIVNAFSTSCVFDGKTPPDNSNHKTPLASQPGARGSLFDRRWAEAVEIGKKNQRTVTLVQNWCAHARIENHGGVGLIQMQTGLPIGHLAVACDYATSGSTMASWDLADAALDFHDSNCVGCLHRKPVRLPNLSELVAERNAAVRAQEARAAAQDLEQVDALRKRRAAEPSLPPPCSHDQCWLIRSTGG